MNRNAIRRSHRRAFLKYLAASPVAGALSGFDFASASDDTGQKLARLADAIDIFDFEATAREMLPPAHFGYLATGVNGDTTLRANRTAFEKYYLRSHRLVDVSSIDMSVNILGREWPSPIVMSPVGSQKAFHPEGELGSARAARARNHLQLLSSVSSTPIEAVCEARGEPVWYQLYPTSRWDITKRLLRRAEAAGCPAVVLTVDLPVTGGRHTLQRSIRKDPRDCDVCHQDPAIAGRPKPMYEGIEMTDAEFDQAALTWEFVDRLRNETGMKVLVKGIVTREDAQHCLDHGVDGIVVSNHGGRADESGRGAIDSLAEVAAVAKGRTLLLMDSGIRRGTDIVKALALGADAVCVGRPYVWGLASFGQAGVERALEILREELYLAMQQAGTPTLASIGPDTIGIH